MSTLPIKQLQKDGVSFIPKTDTLIADENNKVYKKPNNSNELVELVSADDLDSKLDKNNGVATGRLKVKASDTEFPGIMVTTAGDNEDRWFSKLTQDQIEARREYNKESEIYEFFDNENGNKIARYKDVILADQDNTKKNISLINDGNNPIDLKIELKNDSISSSYSQSDTIIKQASIQLTNSATTSLEFSSSSLSLSSSSLKISIYDSQTGLDGHYSGSQISLNTDEIKKTITSGTNGGEENETSYTYSFPDKTGTLALKEDITDIASELTKLDENGTYQIKDLVKIINELLGLLGAREHTIDL